MVLRPALYSLMGLAVVGALAFDYSGLKPSYRLADQVPDQGHATQASRELDAELTGSNPIDVLITFPPGAGLYAPQTLATIADVHKTLETEPGVGNVWSLETLRRWLAEKMGLTSVAALKEYVELSSALSRAALHIAGPERGDRVRRRARQEPAGAGSDRRSAAGATRRGSRRASRLCESR